MQIKGQLQACFQLPLSLNVLYNFFKLFQMRCTQWKINGVKKQENKRGLHMQYIERAQGKGRGMEETGEYSERLL